MVSDVDTRQVSSHVSELVTELEAFGERLGHLANMARAVQQADPTNASGLAAPHALETLVVAEQAFGQALDIVRARWSNQR